MNSFGSVSVGLVAFIFAFVVAVGRNLPYPALYPFGIAPAEILCLILLAALTCKMTIRIDAKALRLFLLVFSLSVVCLVSMLFNEMRYGVNIKEVFEVFRYLLLATVPIIITNFFHCKQAFLIEGYIVGLLVSVFVAYLKPMNPDILGVLQIHNPNVIGYVLVYGAWLPLVSYFLWRGNRNLIYLPLMLSISILTFSKGAWLVVAFILFACLFLLFNSSLARRASVGALLIGLLLVDIGYIGVVSKFVEIISWKIGATDFAASAAEGGSFSARIGLALSGLIITYENPLLGVGLSNFQLIHDGLDVRLGEYYYEDDNPNNVFLYISSGAGVFALLLWILVLKLYFSIVKEVLARIFGMPHLVNFMIFLCFVATTIVGGVTQNEMLNAFYLWFYFGLFLSLKRRFECQQG